LSVYLDTSIVVPLFVSDPFGERAIEYVERGKPSVVISDFVAAEFVSAIARRVRMQILAQDEAQAAFAMFDDWEQNGTSRVEIDPADIRAVESILRRLEFPLRAPDALHIVIAQRLGAELATFDEKMAACARGLGASVVAI
jgi:uncharacterized protein